VAGFPSAPDIHQANSACVSSGSNDGARAFESERTPVVVLSMAAKIHIVSCPITRARTLAPTIRQHVTRMTLLIRMPRTLLEDDLSRRLATAPSTSPDILRNPNGFSIWKRRRREPNPGREGSKPASIRRRQDTAARDEDAIGLAGYSQKFYKIFRGGGYD
jgi:hypothetical protein